MRNQLNIWVVGGDMRQVKLAEALADDGHSVHTFALERSGEALPGRRENSLDGVALADCVVLPLPVAAEGSVLNTPLSGRSCRLEQLLDVPEGAQPVFPDGFTAECLRGVTMMDDTAIVNLTQSGADLLSSLTADLERGCIFSVVNTLTAYAGVNRVQFLVEGVKVDSLAGALSLRSPLVRNPGIIQTSLS